MRLSRLRQEKHASDDRLKLRNFIPIPEATSPLPQMSQADLLSQWKKRKAASAGPAKIGRRPAEALPRPSAGQQRLFLLQQMYPGNLFYQYAHRYDITGKIDHDALQQSFDWLVERQEVLRSNIVTAEDGELLLVKHPVSPFPLETEEVAVSSEESIAAFTHRPFDLGEDQLFRAKIISHGPEQHVLILSIHHIIGDRGSLMVLEGELFDHYTKLLAGEGDSRSALPVQFDDFAHWEATREVPESHFTYWRDQLAGELPLTSLPHDYSRPQARNFAGELVGKTIGSGLSDKLRDLARAHGTTANVVFLSALNAFMYRYTGQEDVLIGSPVSTRDRTELENLVGFLNETVVLRQQVNPASNFNELIKSVKPTVETALSHKDVSFDWLVNELQPERRGGINPFFQTMFVYNSAAPARALPAGLRITDAYVDLGTAKFDLTLFATDHGQQQGFAVGFEYASDLFARDTVESMVGHFLALLEGLVTKPTNEIGTLPLLTAADKNKVLKQWNPTFPIQETAASPKLLTQFFATNTANNPNGIAVSDGTNSLTYGELMTRSTELANQLVAGGLERGRAVGLYCSRTPDLMVGILGIFLAGGAYVPLDPEYPQERINYIVGDSGATTIVHEPELSPPLPEGASALAIPRTGSDKEINLPTVNREQNAYLIYTSGSTGKPKGIAITHDNLAHSTAARFDFYDRQPGAFLLLSSFAFDSSVAGIFWTMASGGKLVLSARRAEQDPAALGRLIKQEGITHTLLLPSLYQLLLEFADRKDLDPLEIVMVAGEACPTALVERHFAALPKTQLVNEYGPTEGTVWSTAHHITPADAGGSVPIGRPIMGMGHYILDKQLQLVPAGVAGELCLSGRQLTAGYHGQPDLSRETFLPNPFSEGERLYRTGDLVRYRKDGTIDFLGRSDQQVKIRGHRIELTEISNALDRLPGVRESVTMVVAKGQDLEIVAYYQPESDGNGEDFETVLAGDLRQQLPEYMVPAVFIQLAEFPRLPNGKVNQKVLPEPEWSTPTPAGEFEAPANELEQQLAELWQKVLKLEVVGRHDNFFNIGGDSLKSIRIIAGAAKAGISIAPHQLFNHQTVAELAAALAPKKTSSAPSVRAYEAAVLLQKGGNLPPLFCLHSGGGHVFFYQPLAQLLNGSRSVYALQPKGLSGETDMPQSIEEMASDYIAAIKEIRPSGPYLLLGTCFSNALAVEMANQLTTAGDEMAPLIIVDSGTGTFMRPDAELAKNSKLTNLINFVREGRWDKIVRRFRNRGILGYRQVASAVDEQKRNLYGTIGALNKIYAEYEWSSNVGKILLIRSTEFAGKKDKDHHVTRWQALVGEVEVHVVEGNHLEMFQEPAVKGLAEKINECLG
jgi:amino acid adenylation domain-containing protein